ncbi:unnamed protein product [Blepharisma stoltei]|uniref:Signal peptidase complex catalytic subunit SEC11 n=1 Tax=Blepharisma stoltei TaxID=1481888 RepID=A0AAU9JAU4_9CILI|nr:unnamed protein product [Blepharisma stoltei]
MQKLRGKLNELKIKDKRIFVHKFINTSLLIATALMAWKGIKVCSNTDTPIVVIVNNSMIPAYYPGDMLLIEMWNSPPLQAGDVIVYNFDGKESSIISRIMSIHEENNDYFIVTKGEKNESNDRAVLWNGKKFIQRKDVVGRVYFFVPYLGTIVIWLIDYPVLKYVLIVFMAIFIGLAAKQPKY